MKSKKIDKCPLCGDTNFVFHSYSNSNLYSEKISLIVDLSEDILLQTVFNVNCNNCGLIFKNKWFTQEDLNQLFTKEVPFHPKGWDAALGRFTPQNFFIELDIYQKAIESNDTSKIYQYRRALLSLVDSIIDANNESEKKRLSSLIESKDIEAIRNSESIIYELINEPTPFKRFAGFSSKAMWDYFEEKCEGVKNYAELGCPLWGMLKHAKSKSLQTSFLKRFEPNYWGNNCINLGSHCTSFANTSSDIPLIDFNTFEKGHLIGFFQYIDHLEHPGEFLKEVFSKFEAAAIILDGVENPVAIQHYTGWTESSINYIAAKFNKTVHTNFEEIKASGNYLYLFV